MYNLFLSFITTLTGSVFTYIIHKPKVGMDDANITLNYAENISKGFGYVYYVDGEKVEGSTSLIWTFINVIFFKISESPEVLINIFTFLLTILIVYLVLFFSSNLSIKLNLNIKITKVIVVFLFIFNPIFFTWTVWSLMDITIWILFFNIISFGILISIIDENYFIKKKFLLFFLFTALILLPLIRPEGISISLGLGFLFYLYTNINKKHNWKNKILISIIFTILLFTIITFIRLNYFGFPFPNTFYAKVSTSYLNQFIWGIKYLIRHLSEPYYFLILLISFIGILNVNFNNQLNKLISKWFSFFFIIIIFGIFFQYVALGGDSFNGSRHFQILTPLLIGFSAITVNFFWEKIDLSIRSKNVFNKYILSILIFFIFISIFLIPNIGSFIYYGGKVNNEFRMAEKQRYVGKKLSELPNNPSIGVYMAGGISMTYHGKIYDMMGLNWIEMAQSNRKHNKNSLKNHSAFDKDVLFKIKPEILFPEMHKGDCKIILRNEWRDAVLVGLFDDLKFEKNYISACYKNIRFFVTKEYYNKYKKFITKPY